MKPLFIYIEQVPLKEDGLHLYRVFMMCQSADFVTGEIYEHQAPKRLDSHWMESTARKCALNWSKFYNVPVRA